MRDSPLETRSGKRKTKRGNCPGLHGLRRGKPKK